MRSANPIRTENVKTPGASAGLSFAREPASSPSRMLTAFPSAVAMSSRVEFFRMGAVLRTASASGTEASQRSRDTLSSFPSPCSVPRE